MSSLSAVDPTPSVPDVSAAVLAQLGRAVYGKATALGLLWQAVLAGGHVLLEDRPGLGKTRAVRSLASAADLTFQRIQFTPDLMPADITGSSMYAPGPGTWSFRPGPVFANLVLADEINRAPAKTQAALLEAMQEGQVTIDGVTHPLPEPFVVVATQNPLEFEGTYPLPEAQLDRFLARLSFDYPAPEEERRLLTGRAARGREEVDIDTVVDAEGIVALRRIVEQVHVDDDVAAYIVDLAVATRSSAEVEVGVSPRGSLALQQLARARAAVEGRRYITPDDVKAVSVPALAHRLVLRPEAWVRQTSVVSVIRACLDTVAVPPTVPRRA